MEREAVSKYIASQSKSLDGAFIPSIIYKGSEVDVLHISNDLYTHEVEFKMTAIGVRYDLQKVNKQFGGKHSSTLSGHRVNYFSFALHESIRGTKHFDEIPNAYGIVIFRKKFRHMVFEQYRKPTLLNSDAVSAGDLLELAKVVGRRFTQHL